MAPGSQTADHALQLLIHAVESDEPLGLAELGRLTGLNKPATYRLVQPLLRHRLLEREVDGRRYVIGSGFVALSATVMQRLEIREVARPYLARLCELASETVSLHILHGLRRICVLAIESPQPVRRVVPLGENHPVYAGPTGKAMLAYLDDETVAAALEIAAAEGKDATVIREHLELVRAQGYLALVSDRVVGVGGLSVPIFGAAGLAGSVTVSGPSSRFDLATMEAAAGSILSECAALSAALGYQVPKGTPASAEA